MHVYASLEALVAASGVAVVYGLPGAGRWLAPFTTPLADHPAALNVARLVTNALVLFVPSTAMGAGLPLLALALGRSDRNFGRVLGRLYGANVVGAVLGVLATDRWLLAAFGVRGSSVVAGALDLAAAGMALSLPVFGIEGVTTSPTRDPSPRGEDPGASIAAARPLVSALLLGFCLLALEVLWLRLLTLFMSDTPSAFATLLATVLAGMSAGGWAASVWLGRSPGASAYAGFMAYGTALCALVGYIAYPSLLQRAFDASQSGSLALVIAVPLVMPASAASGALFALLGAELRESTRSDARAAGWLAAFNSIGSACGSAVAGFVLLPWLGLDRSLFCVLILYGAAGVLLTLRRPRRSSAATALAFGLCLLSFPFGAMRQKLVAASARRWMGPRDEIVAVRESPTATIVQIRHELSGMTIYDQFAQNAYSMTSNNFAARRYMKLFAYLPLAIHPGMRRALVIGYGMGNTAQALTDTRELERIDVVDTTSDLIEMTRRAQPPHGPDPLSDPRLRVHIEDGRYFLQSTSDRFDLITGEPPPPIIAGVVSLYTREYFDLARSRLADGGIVSYWLPTMDIAPSSTRSLLRAFCDAFPDCSLWHAAGPNFMLMGTRDAVGPVTEARFLAQWLDPGVTRELSGLGFELPGELSSLFIGDAQYLAEVTHDVLPLEACYRVIPTFNRRSPRRRTPPANSPRSEVTGSRVASPIATCPAPSKRWVIRATLRCGCPGCGRISSRSPKRTGDGRPWRPSRRRSARKRALLGVDPRMPLQVVWVWRMHGATKPVDRPVQRFDVFRPKGIAARKQLQGALDDMPGDGVRHAPRATRGIEGGDGRGPIGKDGRRGATRNVGHERERPDQAAPGHARAPLAHARLCISLARRHCNLDHSA